MSIDDLFKSNNFKKALDVLDVEYYISMVTNSEYLDVVKEDSIIKLINYILNNNHNYRLSSSLPLHVENNFYTKYVYVQKSITKFIISEEALDFYNELKNEPLRAI